MRAKRGEGAQEEPDHSFFKDGQLNTGGNVVNEEVRLFWRIKQGVLKHLVGRRVDENRIIWNDSSDRIGAAEFIPDDWRREFFREPAPFESFPGATVNMGAYVALVDERVGKVIEGAIKGLPGMKVNEDGDILDRSGNVVGRAERWESEIESGPKPEPEVDKSILGVKRVNKAGNNVDGSDSIFCRVVGGDLTKMMGLMCDKNGTILSERGDVICRAELHHEGEREGQNEPPSFPDAPWVRTARSHAERQGRFPSADRGDEAEVEKPKDPMSGRHANEEGNVVDEDGNIIDKLIASELSKCAGKDIDYVGDVVDGKSSTIGQVPLLSDIKEPEESHEKEKREFSEKDKKLAQQMAYCLSPKF